MTNISRVFFFSFLFLSVPLSFSLLFFPLLLFFILFLSRLSLSPRLSVSSGILKFHEVYLGEGVSEGDPDFQEGAGGGGGGGAGVAGGSSLEQYISSAREALGVESYYSRWGISHQPKQQGAAVAAEQQLNI